MDKTKTFSEYLVETDVFTKEELHALNENLKSELTEEEEAKVDTAIDAFIKEYLDKNKGIKEFNAELTNEGILGSILGGLTGFALGKSAGKMIAKVLGVQKGIFYDLLTSRLVGAAIGASMGKRF